MQPAQCLWLGRRDYREVWQSMRHFTDDRDAHTPDQIWFLEHPPVFTQGQAGKAEHVLAPGDIPVVASDRGGQVTYHGPGQLVVYPLLDLRNLRQGRGLGIRSLVASLERAMTLCLDGYGITALGKAGAPGVYVENDKIGSIGLRVRRQCCYHGISLNVSMDLEPFARINPCGYQGLRMTQIADLGGPVDIRQVAGDLHNVLAQTLGLALTPIETMHTDSQQATTSPGARDSVSA